MKNSSSFFELIKGGIWGDYIPQIVNSPNWQEIFLLAKSQTVAGITFHGLTKLPINQRPPQNIYLSWLAITAQIQETNRLLDHRVAELFRLFKEKNIRSVLLKGQGIARLYSNPGLRQSGDIDIYTYAEDFEKSCTVIRKETDWEEDGEKHFSFHWKEVTIENHHQIFLHANKKLQKSFDNLVTKWFPHKMKTLSIEGQDIFIPPLEFNALFILDHLFHHFINGGVGLRQILDWLMVMRECSKTGSFDKKQFLADLKSLDLLNCAQLIGAIAVHHLGFKTQDLPFSIANDEKMERLVLEDILRSGNFGHALNQRPKGMWTGRWYGFYHSLKRAKKFSAIAPTELHHYMFFRIHIFLKNLRHSMKSASLFRKGFNHFIKVSQSFTGR